MQSASWVKLFEQVPTNLHDSLVLLTTTGTEIMVQAILRLESDFVIFKGRMSGTQDGGRIMIIPYDQIHTVAFAKRLLESDVDKIFRNRGSTQFAAPIELSKGKQIGEEEDVAEEEEEVETTPVAAETVHVAAIEEPTPLPANDANKPAIPGQPSKSLLLARLRARLAGGPK